jgi:hypothetical protein
MLLPGEHLAAMAPRSRWHRPPVVIWPVAVAAAPGGFPLSRMPPGSETPGSGRHLAAPVAAMPRRVPVVEDAAGI